VCSSQAAFVAHFPRRWPQVPAEVGDEQLGGHHAAHAALEGVQIGLAGARSPPGLQAIAR
jgi:hypothetical protein